MKDYPLIKFALLFIAGIVAAKFIGLNLTAGYLLAGILLSVSLFLLIFVKSEKYIGIFSIIIYLASFLCGMIIYQNYVSGINNILPQKLYRQKNFLVYGTITNLELQRQKEIVFECEADSFNITGHSVKKGIKLLCKLRDDSKSRLDSIYSLLHPGNIISLKGIYSKGRERRNPGEFDYNKYLNEQGISGSLVSYSIDDFKILEYNKNWFKSFVFEIRKYINNQLLKLHEPETAALLKGLLISDRSDIDYETKTNFINAGVIHVLAVSGLHVVYILLIFLFLFGRFNPYLRSSLSIVGLLIFMMINGSPASVVRSTIMSVVLIIGYLSNRSSSIYNSLSLSALIILFINPNELFNPGFQLSFAAVLSMVLFYPFFKAEMDKLTINSWLKKFLLFLAVTLSAQIGTMPFVLAYFSKLSIISLAANIVVIPLSGLIISIAFFTLFLNMLLPLLALYAAAINDLLVSGMLWVVKISGESYYAFLRIRQFSFLDALIFYSFTGIAFYYFKWLKRAAQKIAFIILITFNIILFCSLDDEELFTKGEFNLLMIDIGQGDATLLQFPNGKTALIDAGEANYYFDNGERVILPLLDHLGIKKIDYGFISHMDADHYSGFVSLIHEGRINRIMKPALDTASIYDIKFEKYLHQQNVPFLYYEKGSCKIGAAVVFTLNGNLSSEYPVLNTNNRSGLLKIVYGKTNFLFTGDIERKMEDIYALTYGIILKSDVLKVAHHGSITSTNPGIVNFIKPKISLISAGIMNKFHHPSGIVLNRLNSLVSEVHRTDQEGAILIKSNGDSVYYVNWRR